MKDYKYTDPWEIFTYPETSEVLPWHNSKLLLGFDMITNIINLTIVRPLFYVENLTKYPVVVLAPVSIGCIISL